LPGEGYELIEGFYLPPLIFTDNEAIALFLGARLLVQQAAGALTTDAEHALAKISVALPKETRQRVGSLTGIIGFIAPRNVLIWTNPGFNDNITLFKARKF
jgi:predicted DNA-binding transcriptional regulator YafY